jgi:uncharacterized membrane protein YsdA (DUF1294 family)
MFKYYLFLIIIMSTITLIFYIIDKEKAKRNKYRIREKTLVLLSFLLGSCGGLIGMYLIRHKNRHIKFIITNWLFLIIHIVLGYFILTYAI